MPAPSPDLTPQSAEALAAIGGVVRQRRKDLRISAVAAAEAAGISRVTLHRIEKGQPAVTMGAYLRVLVALGLDERNWRYLDPTTLAPAEQDLIEALRLALGSDPVV
jgi:transcriptional regulator with XRE-family HTH domain